MNIPSNENSTERSAEKRLQHAVGNVQLALFAASVIVGSGVFALVYICVSRLFHMYAIAFAVGTFVTWLGLYQAVRILFPNHHPRG